MCGCRSVLLQVEAGMVESMQEVCRQGLEVYAATPRTSWVLQWPSQVVLAISAIYWTQEVSEAMQGPPAPAANDNGGSAAGGQGSKGALGVVAAKCTSQLNEVVELVRGELSVLDRCEATSAADDSCRRSDIALPTSMEPTAWASAPCQALQCSIDSIVPCYRLNGLLNAQCTHVCRLQLVHMVCRAAGRH